MVSGISRLIVCHNCRKNVTAAAHGLDQFRLLRVRLDLAAQTTYLHVDASVERSLGASMGEIEELVPVEHPLRVLGEGDQEIKLAGTQIDDQPLGRLEAPEAQVEPPAAEA
jgi:hypothetical protein